MRDVNDLAKVLHEAFYVATSGRPGPVLVDVPKDVQFAVGTYHPPRKSDVHVSYTPRVKGDAAQIRKAVALLASRQAAGDLFRRRRHQFRPRSVEAAARPGRGHRLSDHLDPDGARRLSGDRARTGSACSACTAPMKPTWRCMIATSCCASARASTTASPAASTRSRRARRRSTSTSIPSSINKNIRVDVPIIGDAGNVMGDLLQVLKAEAKKPDIKAWWQEIAKWRARNSLAYKKNNDVILPQYAIERLFAATRGRDTYITTEVGQHQMWAAQFFGFEEPHRWMTSGGLGTMGYGLPAALGVQVAHRDSLVIDIAGDASVQMTMQEMSTAVQYELPIKIFILNNQYMGMVRQWQQLLHGNRLSHSYSEALPDFVKLADAFGCVGLQAIKPGDLDGAIKEMISGQDARCCSIAASRRSKTASR